MIRRKLQELKIKETRYVASLCLYKRNISFLPYDQNIKSIDMGWGTGISVGIYTNVFKDRGRILNAKRKLKCQK